MAAARPQLPSDFEATAWGKLKEAVNAIHAKKPVSYSFEELYRVRHSSALFLSPMYPSTLPFWT